MNLINNNPSVKFIKFCGGWPTTDDIVNQFETITGLSLIDPIKEDDRIIAELESNGFRIGEIHLIYKNNAWVVGMVDFSGLMKIKI